MSAIVAMAATVLMAHAMYRESHRESVPIIMRNVHVLARYDALNFCMDVEDPDTHERNQFGVRFCDGYPISSEIQPGMTLDELKYEVDYPNRCYSIAADNLGYTWSVDENNQPIFSSFTAEATARPCRATRAAD